jgi:hypothetical protein
MPMLNPKSSISGLVKMAKERERMNEPLHLQIGGKHYKNLVIQPVEYIHANGIGFFEGNVIKYVSRWRDKGGLQDLEKAKHFLELLIDLESRNDKRMEGVSEEGTPSGTSS